MTVSIILKLAANVHFPLLTAAFQKNRFLFHKNLVIFSCSSDVILSKNETPGSHLYMPLFALFSCLGLLTGK